MSRSSETYEEEYNRKFEELQRLILLQMDEHAFEHEWLPIHTDDEEWFL